jgi:predicted nucleotidyltransferase
MSDRDVILQTLDDSGVALQAAYLFGSRARADASASSDFDIAVLAERRIDPVRRWEIQEHLARMLHADVDLVDLRSASTVLCVQVLQDGVVLSDRDPLARAEFEMYALSDYGRLQLERREILKDAEHPGWLRG